MLLSEPDCNHMEVLNIPCEGWALEKQASTQYISMAKEVKADTPFSQAAILTCAHDIQTGQYQAKTK